MGHKEISHEKVTSFAHTNVHTHADTHAHTHKHTIIPHTHGHQVFIVCFLYSYQETSEKLNDHHKQEVTCCDFVIVLEDVHIFILYFMKFKYGL